MAISSGKPVVVFDLDGTLVDVALRDFAVYRDLLLEDGLTPLSFERYWPLRREATELPAVLAYSSPAPMVYLPDFVSRRSARYETPPYLQMDTLLPGVARTLAAVGERYDCVLITSRADAVGTGQQLSALGMPAYFCAVHIANGDKAAVLRTLAGVVLVVGDTEHDVRLACNHGYPSFAVTTGMRSRRFLASVSPTYIADRLSDVLDVLALP
jgi:phosphoglycolate phosphatase-like HAD superfamily hydrolase